jgi:hypothetical protein
MDSLHNYCLALVSTHPFWRDRADILPEIATICINYPLLPFDWNYSMCDDSLYFYRLSERVPTWKHPIDHVLYHILATISVAKQSGDLEKSICTDLSVTLTDDMIWLHQAVKLLLMKCSKGIRIRDDTKSAHASGRLVDQEQSQVFQSITTETNRESDSNEICSDELDVTFKTINVLSALSAEY